MKVPQIDDSILDPDRLAAEVRKRSLRSGLKKLMRKARTARDAKG